MSFARLSTGAGRGAGMAFAAAAVSLLLAGCAGTGTTDSSGAPLAGQGLSSTGSEDSPSQTAGSSGSGEAPSASSLKFSQKAAWSDLLKQCGYGPRDPRLPAHSECLKYIQTQLKPNCDAVITQSFPYNDPARNVTLNLSNVVGVINTKGKEKVMISAHWDTRPTADNDFTPANRDKPILGADDGASGVAVLLELARALHKVKPNCCVELAFWDGEDWGPGEDKMYLGSAYFAKHPGTLKPDESILLDMVGQKKLTLPREAWSDQNYPALDNAVWSAASSAGQSAVFQNKVGQEIIDDQIPLAKMNVPSIDVIDFDYAYWHTLQDTPANCDPNALGAVGKAMEAYVRSIPAAGAALAAQTASTATGSAQATTTTAR